MAQRLNTSFVGIQAVVLVALAIANLSPIEAHPPEFHRRKVNAPKTNIPIAGKKVADEADRQIAYFQFEFLTAFAHQCPTDIVENLLSTAQLTGEEFDWKLLELRWSQPGRTLVEGRQRGRSIRETGDCSRTQVNSEWTSLHRRTGID